jgi:hypothetical protein
MIIVNLNVFGTVVRAEADSELIVDANAVVSVSIATKSLEPIPRGAPQIFDAVSSRDHLELSASGGLEARERRNADPGEEILRFVTSEASYQCDLGAWDGIVRIDDGNKTISHSGICQPLLASRPASPVEPASRRRV